MKGYIDAGDRVISVSEVEFGVAGLVLNNDGCGRCHVRLDNGKKMSCLNGCHLIREGDSLPNRPYPNDGHQFDAYLIR